MKTLTYYLLWPFLVCIALVLSGLTWCVIKAVEWVWGKET